MNTAARMRPVDSTVPIVRSEIMRKLMAMVERVARHDAAVLIVGETGSGKELVARAIHQHSLRCAEPFVDVNCAALPEHLVESELFGYEKGAFSGAEGIKQGLFELADGGTLFLDEIGELDAKVQAKLLRVLDGVPYYRLGGNKKVAVRVRIIAATNRQLEEEIRSGKFRRDLYHRLTQFQLNVPPLRERLEDIVGLAEHFIEQHDPSVHFTGEAMEMLQQYGWPGNVRELKNVVFRAAMHAKPGAKEIRASDLPSVICGLPDQNAPQPSFNGNLGAMEKQMILQALANFSGNQEKAAQQLGISSRTLRRKLDKYRKEDAKANGGMLGTLQSQQQRYFRVTIELPVMIAVEGQQVEGTIVNVSAGGIAAQCPLTLSHGASVDLSFTLPDSAGSIDTKAKLAWSSPGGLVGLSFADMHPAIERQLQQWLLARARDEGWTESAGVT